jgi:hypothetical protein
MERRIPLLFVLQAFGGLDDTTHIGEGGHGIQKELPHLGASTKFSDTLELTCLKGRQHLHSGFLHMSFTQDSGLDHRSSSSLAPTS